MPIVLPHIIKSDSIAVYGDMVGIRKMQYSIPMLQTVVIMPTQMSFKEQVLIGHSFVLSETFSRAEAMVKGESYMFSETPNRAETVIITNV